jgi:hypothetical protein
LCKSEANGDAALLKILHMIMTPCKLRQAEQLFC